LVPYDIALEPSRQTSCAIMSPRRAAQRERWPDKSLSMNIELSEVPINSVAELERVPISFTVDRVCDVLPVSNGLVGFVLLERPIKMPYVKSYDGIHGEGPAQWASRFNISNWGFIRAQSNGRLIGGAVIAVRTANVAMLEARMDLAVLWDIRVSPDVRGQGVGSALFRAVEAWAVARGCRQLKIETQNINVGACRFYARHGCVLGEVQRSAYPHLPDEVQLLWYKDLVAADTATNTPEAG
jgi:GNAT superfamily N-acetyltransferase